MSHARETMDSVNRDTRDDPGMSHARQTMDPGILSIPGYQGRSWDVPC